MAARGRYFNRQGSTGNQNHGSPLPMSGSNNYGSHRNNDNSSPRPSSGSSYSSMNDPTRGPRPNQPVCIGEEVKIGIHLAFERFRLNPEQKELEFPSSLTATERAYIHRLCEDYNLKSKSHGKGASRCLTIYKKEGNQSSGTSVTFQLARNSRHQILSLMQRFPLTNKERQELQPKTHKSTVNEIIKDLNYKTTTGRLNNGVPQIPPQRGNSDLNSFRESLPIQEYQEDIIHTINHNQVVLVSSETGSGKTTQVPQMILDDCFANSKPCRIFCTQPRRIAALSIAERVAAERGEKIGQTIGYQIRLESKVSPKTLLTFCTNGVLLRTLMGGDSSLTAVTHILVDEVHERDRFSDFLLIVLRDALVKYKNLRLVLMSATLNTDLFLQYFNRCPIALIPGTLFDVQEFFLEDILKWTEYSNKKMLKFKKEQYKVEKQQEQLSEWCHHEMINDDKPSTTSVTDSAIDINTNTHLDEQQLELGQECDELEDWVIQEMDRLLGELWLTGNEDLFSQVFHLILSENVSVDYKHSETSVTPLMIASGRGFSNIVEKLLSLGANINIKASNEWTALDWSKKFEQNDIVDMLEGHLSTLELGTEESVNQKNDETISTEDRELLKTYQHSFDDEKVDIDLLSILLYKIHTSQPEGAVLVFLPGYDDIVALRDRVSEDKKFEQSRYVLYVLHSSIQSSDQKRVFKQPPAGVRKIILSTNIAETSITINDVVYVVDCGKVKEKTFDALSGITMLKSNWISKASSQQRKGRAGRCHPGICYHHKWLEDDNL
ncbi:3'-5' RNA helicase YTHDC2 [Patella vulgata]|uniref:3'-5' RNA helicase YTHDC2 n=1 Tax=Patella vulgata TaxID=6465 RepID=UPI0024A994F0|nr:3'-5' RNA helicase YTHDC2 [Patella vulgata]